MIQEDALINDGHVDAFAGQVSLVQLADAQARVHCADKQFPGISRQRGRPDRLLVERQSRRQPPRRTRSSLLMSLNRTSSYSLTRLISRTVVKSLLASAGACAGRDERAGQEAERQG